MSKRKTNIALIAIPTTIALASAGLFARHFLKKKEIIPEEVKTVTKNAVKDIENTVSELKDAIENKSVIQLEKNIDNAVENAKTSIEKIATGIKVQLQEVQGSPSTIRVQAS